MLHSTQCISCNHLVMRNRNFRESRLVLKRAFRVAPVGCEVEARLGGLSVGGSVRVFGRDGAEIVEETEEEVAVFAAQVDQVLLEERLELAFAERVGARAIAAVGAQLLLRLLPREHQRGLGVRAGAGRVVRRERRLDHVEQQRGEHLHSLVARVMRALLLALFQYLRVRLGHLLRALPQRRLRALLALLLASPAFRVLVLRTSTSLDIGVARSSYEYAYEYEREPIALQQVHIRRVALSRRPRTTSPSAGRR